MINEDEWTHDDELMFVGYSAPSLDEVELALKAARNYIDSGVWREVKFKIDTGYEDRDFRLFLSGYRRKTQQEIERQAADKAQLLEYERQQFERLKAKFGGT